MKDNTSGAFTNCFQNNGMATFTSLGACNGFKQSTDIAPYTCEHTAIVPVKP